MPALSSGSSPDSGGSREQGPPKGGPLLAGHRLSNPFLLAPVAGYSDAAFRSVCAEQGAALCYTEMVSAEALIRNHPKTGLLLERTDAEPLYAVQLFGANPESLGRAAARAAALSPLVIDLNCGCPVPKIVRTGAGSSLLKDPRKIHAIVRSMRNSTDVPITVKIRKGWDDASINFLETADAAVDAGAVAVTLHARTRAQGYAGKADWPAIAELKEAMTSKGIPVFGSGDVFSAVAALGILAETGADGVMIARGSMGNPFVFAEALAMWEERPYTACSDAELAAMATRHLDRSVASLGEKTACIEFRKHFCAYSKGRERGAALREKAVHCSTRAEFEEVFKALAAHDPGTSDTAARQA